jgi:hypothetical protein
LLTSIPVAPCDIPLLYHKEEELAPASVIV